MSRLGLKTISFKTGKKNLVVLPNIKLLSTAVPNTFRVYKKEEGSREPNQGCLVPTKNGLLGIIHQAFHMAAVLDGVALLSSRTTVLHQTGKNTLISHHTLTWLSSP